MRDRRERLLDAAWRSRPAARGVRAGRSRRFRRRSGAATARSSGTPCRRCARAVGRGVTSSSSKRIEPALRLRRTRRSRAAGWSSRSRWARATSGARRWRPTCSHGRGWWPRRTAPPGLRTVTAAIVGEMINERRVNCRLLAPSGIAATARRCGHEPSSPCVPSVCGRPGALRRDRRLSLGDLEAGRRSTPAAAAAVRRKPAAPAEPAVRPAGRAARAVEAAAAAAPAERSATGGPAPSAAGVAGPAALLRPAAARPAAHVPCSKRQQMLDRCLRGPMLSPPANWHRVRSQAPRTLLQDPGSTSPSPEHWTTTRSADDHNPGRCLTPRGVPTPDRSARDFGSPAAAVTINPVCAEHSFGRRLQFQARASGSKATVRHPTPQLARPTVYSAGGQLQRARSRAPERSRTRRRPTGVTYYLDVLYVSKARGGF